LSVPFGLIGVIFRHQNIIGVIREYLLEQRRPIRSTVAVGVPQGDDVIYVHITCQSEYFPREWPQPDPRRHGTTPRVREGCQRQSNFDPLGGKVKLPHP
jgi:DNA-binding IclR family transcriptional regulator